MYSPEIMIANAELWVKENPSAWAYIHKLIDNEVTHKRWCSMSWAIEQMRHKDFTNTQGKPTKTSNSYAPVFARIYLRENPNAAMFLDVRTSRVDKYFDDVMVAYKTIRGGE